MLGNGVEMDSDPGVGGTKVGLIGLGVVNGGVEVDAVGVKPGMNQQLELNARSTTRTSKKIKYFIFFPFV
jgi:hypothetical protein